jgi:hypothetical protein
MSGQKSNTTQSKKLHNPKSHAPAVFIPCWLIQVPHKLLSFGAKLLYGRLAQWSNTNGDVFRSAPQLSKELGIGVRTIEKFIKELKNVELIETYHLQAGGQNYFRFFDHEWMHDKLVEELDPPNNRAVPPEQPCGTPPNNRADINIKEIKEIKDISESVDSPIVNDIVNQVLDAYHETLPNMPKVMHVTTELRRAIKKMEAEWPSLRNKVLTKEVASSYFQGLKELTPFLLQPYKTKEGNIRRNRLINLIRLDTIKKFYNGDYDV